MESNHHRITTMGQGSNLVAYHYALSSNLYFLLCHTFQSVVNTFLKIIFGRSGKDRTFEYLLPKQVAYHLPTLRKLLHPFKV